MKRLFLITFIVLASIFAKAQAIEQTYHYSTPFSRTLDGYEILNFEGCRPTGDIGTPILPWQSVSLMLPQGQEAKSISIEFSDFVELTGRHDLYPVQPERPISAEGPFEFVKNEELYRSAESFPTRTESEVKTQYMNGVGFALSGFTPMRYVASTGTVSYARTVKVKVETMASRSDQSRKLWLRPENISIMKKLAQNEDMLSTYQRRDAMLPEYEVLVITPETYVGHFDDYITQYALQGLRVRVASTEEIYDAMEGRDNKEKIRNYIVDEYEKNGITMVVFGGDVDLVPHRNLWCFAQEGYQDNVPADLYYAGLDGTWNEDGDNKWGEIGEDDLFPEIGISRLPFNNMNELELLLGKTFSYLNEPVLGEFHKTTLAGEHLGDGYYASSDLERLVGESDFNGYTTYGYDEDIYEIGRVYETPNHWWNPDELRDAIREGTQYVNHFGHANTSYVGGWYNWDINSSLFAGANGVDHNYTVFHSQGCICGDFADDCILERMVLNQTGVIVASGNSRYGWYSTAGDASSAHFNRELVDAHVHDRIPELALAFKDAKIMMAPYVTMFGESGTMRWTLYALNVIGDGTLSVWFDEPFTPIVEYPEVLELGTRLIPIDVKDENGNGLLHFRCNLFNGDELIGVAYTDENGHADIEFYPVNNEDTLTVVVAGMSAWPQSFEMTFPDADCSWVIYDAYEIHDEDGQVDFSENQTIDMTFRNVGNLDASNFTATLTCDNPDYAVVTNGEANISGLASYQYLTLENAFDFTVSDSIADNTEIAFTLVCNDGTSSWTSHFKVPVHAPYFAVTNIELEEVDGNGNGIADYGETMALHFTIQNTGSSLAPETYFGVYCSAPEISFEENIFTIGELNPSETAQVDFTFSIAPDMTMPTAFELILATYSGRYVVYDNYYVNVGCEIEDFETGDFSNYDWQFEGTHDWTISSNGAYEGSFCAKSPQISDNQSASIWLDYDVACQNEFSFYYKVSSENAYDWLSFYVDGELLDRWSGEQDWARATFILPEGQHQLKWEYSKDAGASSGQDRAWVDFIVFPPDVVVLGVGSETSDDAILYPNPSNGDFTIVLNETSEINIFNALGQNCMTLSKAEGKQNIHLDKKGLYFIQISNASGVTTKKMLVE